MSNKTRLKVKKVDGELLVWWQEWLKALSAEMAANDGHEAERRHERVEVIQRTIAHTPSEGLLGIAVKLALTSYLEGFADGSDGDLGRSAYLDTLRIVERDFIAEAEDVVTRCRERALT